MVASVASFGSLDPTAGLMARAVAPAAAAPVLNDRPRSPAAIHVGAQVALAPAAMTALLQAQEQMAKDAPMLARTPTVVALDQLIGQMTDAPLTAAQVVDAPMALRQLVNARAQLVQG